MKTSWDQSLAWVLESEGGNNDDPNDPGGRTSRGITQKEYDHYCDLKHRPRDDVWRAANMFIRDIYQNYYWEPYCDGLRLAIDYMFFDMAVNHGPYRAVVTIQRALKVDDDGHLGVITKTSIDNAEIRGLIELITLRRKTFYRQIRTYRHFGEGWVNRANFVRANALKMIEVTP